MFVSASHFFRRPIEYPLVCIAIAIILFSSSMVFAHGGMTHADNAFTPLQALFFTLDGHYAGSNFEGE